jgi:hypothetical protein
MAARFESGNIKILTRYYGDFPIGHVFLLSAVCSASA